MQIPITINPMLIPYLVLTLCINIPEHRDEIILAPAITPITTPTIVYDTPFLSNSRGRNGAISEYTALVIKVAKNTKISFLSLKVDTLAFLSISFPKTLS